MVKYFWLLIGIIYLSVSGFGQQDLVIRQLNKATGLSQNSVFAITQDAEGFIWFGTRDGLNRYDGINFKTFRHKPSAEYGAPPGSPHNRRACP